MKKGLLGAVALATLLLVGCSSDEETSVRATSNFKRLVNHTNPTGLYRRGG